MCLAVHAGYYSAINVDPYYGLLPEIKILIRATPYLVGLITARAFQRWVDGSKPLPYCFRAKSAAWTDWRHRLAVSLLGWFSTEQSIEILEDYQERFDLGREQGRSETDILSEMGRPATVVRDLLEEDRKARLRHRKQWPWVVMCVFAGWLLLGLARTFEFGYPGFGWFYAEHDVQIGTIAVILGAASLSVLLHVRERAMVERRFPVEKKPSVWVFLLPFAVALGINGFLAYLGTFIWQLTRARHVLFYIVVGTESSVLILCVLLVWTLARCFSGSIRYLPAAVHAAGCIAYALCTGIICYGIDFESRAVSELFYSWFLFNLLPYAVGVVLAAGIWLLIRSAGKPQKEG